jgi:hypothetical protein
MVKTFLLTLFILTFTIGCNQREGEQKTGLMSHLVNISDTEDAGVKDVLGFYGGYCEYSLGKAVSTDEKTKNYFELKLSKSEVTDQYKENPSFPASNIAYRFYRNLRGARQTSFRQPFLAGFFHT